MTSAETRKSFLKNMNKIPGGLHPHAVTVIPLRPNRLEQCTCAELGDTPDACVDGRQEPVTDDIDRVEPPLLCRPAAGSWARRSGLADQHSHTPVGGVDRLWGRSSVSRSLTCNQRSWFAPRVRDVPTPAADAKHKGRRCGRIDA
jgi:hypothetical protein